MFLFFIWIWFSVILLRMEFASWHSVTQPIQEGWLSIIYKTCTRNLTSFMWDSQAELQSHIASSNSVISCTIIQLTIGHVWYVVRLNNIEERSYNEVCNFPLESYRWYHWKCSKKIWRYKDTGKFIKAECSAFPRTRQYRIRNFFTNSKTETKIW